MLKTGKWLRIRVTDMNTGKSKANVSVPASLANFGMKMAAKFAPEEIEGLDMEQLLAEIESKGETKLLDIEDEEKGEHVEIFVE